MKRRWFLVLMGILSVGLAARCTQQGDGQKIKLDNTALRQAQAATKLATTLQVQPESQKSIAVFFFENVSGKSDLDWMKRGLMEMLVTDLSQSRYLEVVGEPALEPIIRGMGIAAGPALDASLAVAVAKQAKLETVLIGSFVSIDRSIRINAQLYDALTGSLLKADQVECQNMEGVFTMVDELTKRIRDGLRLTLKGVVEFDKNLADATTSSIEAYRQFAEGLRRYDMYFFEEAVDFFIKAIEVDSTFATAYARLALTYGSLGRVADARDALALAVKLADRVAERERFSILALDAQYRGDYGRLIELQEQMVSLYPQDKEAHLRLGNVYYSLRRYDDAIVELEKALGIDSAYKAAYNLLGYAYFFQGMYERALECHRRYMDLAPDEPNPHDSMGEIYLLAGRFEEALQEFKEAIRLKSDLAFPWEHVGQTYLDQGKSDEAIGAFRRYFELCSSAYLKSYALELVGEALWANAQYAEALKTYREALKLSPDRFHLAGRIMDLHERLGSPAESRKFREEWFSSTADRIMESKDFSTVVSFIGTCLYKDIHIDELEPFLGRAGELAGNEFTKASCAYLSGIMHVKRSEYDTALTEFEASARTFLSIETGKGMEWYDTQAIARAIAGNPTLNTQGGSFLDEAIEAANQMNNPSLATSLRYMSLQKLSASGDEQAVDQALAETGTPDESAWWILGPFPNEGCFHHRYPPEKQIDLSKTYKGKAGEIRWVQAQDSLLDGYVNLQEIFADHDWAVGYCLLHCECPTARPAQFRIGTDEAMKIWLNGEQVWAKNIRHTTVVDGETMAVMLKEGTNQILIKLCQRLEAWGFYFRVTDSQGIPFPDLTFTSASLSS